MIVIRKKDTKQVIHLINDRDFISLKKMLKTKNFNDISINSNDFEFIECKAPDFFVKTAMSYDGTWSVINQEIYDKAYNEHLQKIKDEKCKQIDANTKKSIIALAGSDAKQRNMSAKAIQLTKKLIDGTITTEESAQLDGFNALFEQVETLINDGNAKEAEVQACTTVDEVVALGY